MKSGVEVTDLETLMAMVHYVCRCRFPKFDYREFLGYVWESMRGRQPTFRLVHSAMIDCYRFMSAARQKLRITYYGVSVSGVEPRCYRPDGECEARRISAAVQKHGGAYSRKGRLK